MTADILNKYYNAKQTGNGEQKTPPPVSFYLDIKPAFATALSVTALLYALSISQSPSFRCVRHNCVIFAKHLRLHAV